MIKPERISLFMSETVCRKNSLFLSFRNPKQQNRGEKYISRDIGDLVSMIIVNYFCVQRYNNPMNAMSKRFLFIVLAMFTSIIIIAQSPGGGTPVIPPSTPPGGIPKPHAPAFFPVTVFYYQSLSTFVVNNYSDVGYETVVIVSPTGTIYTESVDSADTPVLTIPIMPESGLWIVTVVTETAGTFTGSCSQ